MKKIILLAAIVCLITASCSKEFTKKHEARFKVNSIEYNCGENGVSASYYNGNSSQLQITAIGGNSSGEYG